MSSVAFHRLPYQVMIALRAIRKAVSKRLVFHTCETTRAAFIPLNDCTSPFNAQIRRRFSQRSFERSSVDFSTSPSLISYGISEFRLSKPPGFRTSNLYEFSHPPEFHSFGYLSSFSGLSSFCRTLRTMSPSGIPSHDPLPSEIVSIFLSHHRNRREILLELFQRDSTPSESMYAGSVLLIRSRRDFCP
jgi:hypothetical protein